MSKSVQNIPSGTRFGQRMLFCACGSGVPAVAGLCRSCYGRDVRSRSYFGGNRETVLERDQYTCQICRAGNQRIVHHRRPGNHHPDLLLTICPACHARVHRLAAMDRYLTPALVPIWAEQHPGATLQLQFGF